MPDADQEDIPSLKEFDDFLSEFLDPFVTLSKSIDPLVEEQAVHLAKALEGERKMIGAASNSQKPKDLMDPSFQQLFNPVMQQGAAIGNVRESNRSSKFSNHLATIAEGVPALGWVTEQKPIAYITDFKDAAQFYGNKVMKEFRETDKKQVEWIQSFNKLLNGLQAYVKKHHTTGLTWNSAGKPLSEVVSSVESSPEPEEKKAPAPPAPAPAGPPSGGAPPPPPPPPPMPPASVFQVDDKPTGMGAVFADLNKGEGVTAGLKKVDKSEMTHKNPELRKSEPVSTSEKKKNPTPPKKPASLIKRKPRKALENNDTRWIVENFEDEHEIVIDAQMDQSVFIDRCTRTTVQVKGKVNTIFVNNCKDIGLMAENLVGAVELVKCSNFKVQVTGALPTCSIDQSNIGQLYLGEQSKEAEVYSSQSTGLNVCLATDEDMGDYKEMAVPEQLVHKIKDGQLVSEIVEHAD